MTTFYGPQENDYISSDVVGFVSGVPSPCGADGILHINTEIRLHPKTQDEEDSMTIDSVDYSFDQVFHLSWQRCS